MKARPVMLFRIKRNGLGILPRGYLEGAIVGLTDSEYKSLLTNKTLVNCFEPVELMASPKMEEPSEDKSGHNSDGATLDGKILKDG